MCMVLLEVYNFTIHVCVFTTLYSALIAFQHYNLCTGAVTPYVLSRNRAKNDMKLASFIREMEREERKGINCGVWGRGGKF